MALNFVVNFLGRISLLLVVVAMAGCGTEPGGVTVSKSGGGVAGTETAATGKPETGKPEIGTSETKTPETGKSELAKPGEEIADPGTTDSGTAAAEPSPESADGTPRPVVKGGILSAAELAKILDLRQLPALKGTEFHKRTAAEIAAAVPAKVPEILDFYRKAFAELGFRPIEDSPLVTEDVVQVELARDGFVALMGIMKGFEPDTMNVFVKRRGAFDCRNLPVSEGEKFVGTTLGHAWFYAQGSLAEKSDFVVKALVKQGWQEFEDPINVLHESPDQRRFSLRNQGYWLEVKVAELSSSIAVSYQVETIAHEIPTPANARRIVFDDANLSLKCLAPGDIADVAKFYRDAMPKLGYKDLQKDDPKPNRILMRFEPAEKGIMVVDLATQDHKTTNVELTYHSPKPAAESDSPKK